MQGRSRHRSDGERGEDGQCAEGVCREAGGERAGMGHGDGGRAREEGWREPRPGSQVARRAAGRGLRQPSTGVGFGSWFSASSGGAVKRSRSIGSAASNMPSASEAM